MAHWEFDEVKASSVRMEVTQTDQFNNDDVGLAEALVRESIQNSSDATNHTGPVRVRFSIREVQGAAASAMKTQLAQLHPHYDACRMDDAFASSESFRVLAIEDFNTHGLTGSRDDTDEDNFDRFWRVHGGSGKTGKAGGRWGLGKLVYSSASAAKVFYGLTITKDDPQPCLLGQVVLETHRIGAKRHPAHGFYFASRVASSDLQVPIRDVTSLAYFRELAGLRRTSQTGLSLMIPHLLDSIDEESIIAGVITNYYFPILAGKLIVEVGDVEITKSTFLKIAAQHQAVHPVPFDFVKEISDGIETSPDITASALSGKSELGASSFSQEQIATLKARFAAGELVRIRVPVRLKPKDKADTTGTFDLYLKSLPEGEKPYALIARGPLTLPGERRYFGGAAAYGALVASRDDAADFLGDAENPAHTAWNPRAKKLASRWRSPQDTLYGIRHSLRQLYVLIAEQAESEDTEALIDFFSILDQNQAAKGKKRKRVKPPVIDIPKREKAISIRARKGGFDVVSGPAAAKWTYPRNIRVRVAYDMIGANPFKRHSPFDFDLVNDDDIGITATNATATATKPNVVQIVATSADFHLQVEGFDLRRDLIVDARAV